MLILLRYVDDNEIENLTVPELDSTNLQKLFVPKRCSHYTRTRTHTYTSKNSDHAFFDGHDRSMTKNKLRFVDESIGRLTKLTTLYLFECELSTLPDAIRTTNIETLFVVAQARTYTASSSRAPGPATGRSMETCSKSYRARSTGCST